VNDDTIRALIALARFTQQALGLYVREVQDAKQPTMSLKDIGDNLLHTLDLVQKSELTAEDIESGNPLKH